MRYVETIGPNGRGMIQVEDDLPVELVGNVYTTDKVPEDIDPFSIDSFFEDTKAAKPRTRKSGKKQIAQAE